MNKANKRTKDSAMAQMLGKAPLPNPADLKPLGSHAEIIRHEIKMTHNRRGGNGY